MGWSDYGWHSEDGRRDEETAGWDETKGPRERNDSRRLALPPFLHFLQDSGPQEGPAAPPSWVAGHLWTQPFCAHSSGNFQSPTIAISRCPLTLWTNRPSGIIKPVCAGAWSSKIYGVCCCIYSSSSLIVPWPIYFCMPSPLFPSDVLSLSNELPLWCDYLSSLISALG